MNYYAVIDTNVLISAMLKHDSVPGSIIDLAFDGPITPVLNEVREKQILDLRFGLSDGVRRSFEEVGEILSISWERVRQVEERALRKLDRKSQVWEIIRRDRDLKE